MAADSGIDPRYAAQFQRGFDPARHDPTPLPDPRSPVRVAAAAPPTVRLVPPPPPVVARSSPPPAEPASAEKAEKAEKAEAAADEDLPAGVELRWQWALPVLAAVLIAAAALLFWTSATDARMYTGALTQEDYMLASMQVRLPGPLFVVGILVLSVWLVARGLTRRDPR